MTPKQRRVVGALAIANLVFLVTMFVFVTRFRRSPSLPATPSRLPAETTKTHFSPACQRRAVRLLSEAGLAGTVNLADETMVLDLVYGIGGNDGAEEAAQQVWTAFDVALAMNDDPCSGFSHVEVVIEARGAPTATVTYATVDTADLEAFDDGELTEHAFIERVGYRLELGNDR